MARKGRGTTSSPGISDRPGRRSSPDRWSRPRCRSMRDAGRELVRVCAAPDDRGGEWLVGEAAADELALEEDVGELEVERFAGISAEIDELDGVLAACLGGNGRVPDGSLAAVVVGIEAPAVERLEQRLGGRGPPDPQVHVAMDIAGGDAVAGGGVADAHRDRVAAPAPGDVEG